MFPFIVFEGLDGAGKTTIAKALAAEMGAVYIATPPSLLENVREIIDTQVSVETRFLYYLLGNSIVSDQIKKMRNRKPIVCDRYIHSTLSFHQLLGIKIDDNVIKALNLEIPDIIFFIYVSDEQERQRRIRKRNKRTKYDILKDNLHFREKYLEYFYRQPGIIFIDTNRETKRESLKKIKKVISEQCLKT